MIRSMCLSALVGLAALSGAYAAESTPTSLPNRSCFFSRDFSNWKAPDDKTIYIRVGLKRYFRLDMAGKCPQLQSPGAILVTVFRGSTVICSALDWDLKVSRGPEEPAIGCIVKTMTELSPDEVAAIPKSLKP